MIDLIRACKTHTGYSRRLLAFVPSILIAEFYYKFGSFALECLAFLVTWLIGDLLIEFVLGRQNAQTITCTSSRNGRSESVAS